MFIGKAAYCAEHSFKVRLEDNDPRSGVMDKQQVLHNDLARVILRERRSDLSSTEELASRAAVPSVNQLAFRASAMIAWQAANEATHPAAAEFRARSLHPSTRGAALDKLKSVVASSKALALLNAVNIWNWSPELRAADSRHKAETVIKKLLTKIPL